MNLTISSAHPHKWHSDPSPADFCRFSCIIHGILTLGSRIFFSIFQVEWSPTKSGQMMSWRLAWFIYKVNIGIFHSLLFGCPLSQDLFLMRCHPPPRLHSESGPCHQPTRFHQSGRLRKQNKQTRWTTTTNNQTSRRSRLVDFCWGAETGFFFKKKNIFNQFHPFPMTDPWCWYINANMTGVYCWYPCYHI